MTLEALYTELATKYGVKVELLRPLEPTETHLRALLEGLKTLEGTPKVVAESLPAGELVNNAV